MSLTWGPFRSAGDQLADSTITLTLALELLSHGNHAPSFTSDPDMEPIKVQSEGGLNVTLTIRLLMHGKVEKTIKFPETPAAFPMIFQRRAHSVSHQTHLTLFCRVSAGGGEHHRKGISHKHKQQSIWNLLWGGGSVTLCSSLPERGNSEEDA